MTRGRGRKVRRALTERLTSAVYSVTISIAGEAGRHCLRTHPLRHYLFPPPPAHPLLLPERSRGCARTWSKTLPPCNSKAHRPKCTARASDASRAPGLPLGVGRMGGTAGTVGIKVLTTNRCSLSTLQLQRSLLQPQVCRLCGASCGRIFFSCTVLHGPCLCCAIPQGLRLLRPCLVHVAPCSPPSLCWCALTPHTLCVTLSSPFACTRSEAIERLENFLVT
jgi:hypothetical protein